MRKVNDLELKKICIEILRYIDEICYKNKLTYFVNFGTLIGTVRHKGFIPWDDDVDICMPRADYEKFLEIVEQDNVYNVLHGQKDKYYYFNFARVCDRKTILKFKGIPHIENMGVFVDVFPLDYVPENDELRDELFRNVDRLNYMIRLALPSNLRKTIFLKEKLRSIKNYKLYIKAKRMGIVYLIQEREHLMRKYENSNTELMSCMCPSDDKMTFKEKEYLEIERLPFEDIMINAPKNYDMILRKYYGDYMKLPPDNERISNHHFTAFWK